MSKSTNSVLQGLESGRTTQLFEIIYSDLSGKQVTPTYGNSLYYIIFIDDYTRMVWIFFLKNKSDTSKVIQEFITYVERQFKTTVLCMITDNGGEYIEAEVNKFFRSKGIRYLYTPPYSHQLNGVSERYNRTIQTMVRGMLIDYPDQHLWGEACQVAVYLQNRLPHSQLPQKKTPFEMLYQKQPSIGIYTKYQHF